MASLSPAQMRAAKDFVSTVAKVFNQAGIPPAETIIAATSRMAGSFLLRSFNLPLEGIQPGTVVLSEQANEQGPRLIQILGGMLGHLGVTLDPCKLAAYRGKAHQPQKSFLDTQKLLEPQFIAIRDKYALSNSDAAESAAVATAALIKNCAGLLDPHVSFGLALYGFVEGSKTAPAV